MEPSPKKFKADNRYLNQEDAEVIRKLSAAFEKHLRLKNLQKREVEEELRQVKEIVKKDATFCKTDRNECQTGSHQR
jgi:hypothetical protein